jgi:hypothetical protein
MRRTSLVTILVFVAGLGIGFFTRSAYTDMLQRRTYAADLAAIEKLHQEDIEATLTQDPKGLVDIWADDAVRINPGSPPEVGKEAIGAVNEKVHAQYPDFRCCAIRPNTKTFKSRTAWRASGANIRGYTNFLQKPRRLVSTPKESTC